MHSPPTLTPSPTDSRLRDRTRRRSWAWLSALRRQLEVEVQLVDESIAPLLTDIDRSSPLMQLFEAEPGPLREAVAAARERGAQQRTLGAWVVACVPLPSSQYGDGSLVVARHVSDVEAQPRMLGRVLALGMALVQAVQGHLSSESPAEAHALERVTSLTRILADVAATSTDRQIVERFAEVMAVWHDVDVTAYVADDAGVYHRVVTLPGVDLKRSPETLTPDALPPELASRRSARADGPRLGFTVEEGGTLMLSLSSGVASGWLLALTGQLHEDGGERTAAFVDVLDAWLGHATAAASGRYVPNAAAHLQADRAPVSVARDVLDTLTTALHGAPVSLSVRDGSGLPLLHADAGGARAGQARGQQRGQMQGVRRQVAVDGTITVSLASEESSPLTPQTRRLLADTADLLQPWLHRHAPALQAAAMQRLVTRPEDAAIDGPAADAFRRGLTVSVVLLRTTPDDVPGSVIGSWLDRIKGTLRASDVAAAIGPGEIGVMLVETTAARAEVIADRLRALLGAPPRGYRIDVGVAAGAPGELPANLTQHARAEAISRAAI